MLFGCGRIWRVSILVALPIVRSGYAVVKNAAHILMEGAPIILTKALHQSLSAHPNVLSVHDLHVWTITSGLHSLSCHIIVPSSLYPTANWCAIIRITTRVTAFGHWAAPFNLKVICMRTRSLIVILPAHLLVHADNKQLTFDPKCKSRCCCWASLVLFLGCCNFGF